MEQTSNKWCKCKVFSSQLSQLSCKNVDKNYSMEGREAILINQMMFLINTKYLSFDSNDIKTPNQLPILRCLSFKFNSPASFTRYLSSFIKWLFGVISFVLCKTIQDIIQNILRDLFCVAQYLQTSIDWMFRKQTLHFFSNGTKTKLKLLKLKQRQLCFALVRIVLDNNIIHLSLYIIKN